MNACVSLHHLADCCGICYVTVCEQPDDLLSVNIQWMNETSLLTDLTLFCLSTCKALHDLLIANGVEMTLAEQVCSRMNLAY